MTEKIVKNKKGQECPKKKKNVLLIIVSAVVGLALTLGIVLGIINFIDARNAIMEYEGVRMDEKVASYLVSVYKPTYIADLKNPQKRNISYASDSEEFWSMQDPEGSGTFGEGFKRASEQYLKEILVGTYLYDKNTKMSDKTEEAIKKSADQVLEYHYGTAGFDVLFAKDAEKMGYDYEAYHEAAQMLYKSSRAWEVIYGSSGEGAIRFSAECNEFLNIAYSHVQLAFVRTKTTFKLDEDGNRVHESGKPTLDELTYTQINERIEKIASVKSMIDDYNNGRTPSAPVTQATVVDLAKEYKTDQSLSRIDKGYYFSPYSEYTTKSFLDEYDKDGLNKIVEIALSLSLNNEGGTYAYVDLSLTSNEVNGKESVTCFIYKSAPAKNAYADVELSDFFTDFFTDAAELYFYPKEVKARCESVEVKDKFYEMHIAAIPQNNIHKIREFLREE